MTINADQQQPTESMEISMAELPCDVTSFFEGCAALVVMYRIHDTLAWWLILLHLALVYIYLCTQPRSIVIDFQKKLAIYLYPKYLFFKKHKQISLSSFTLVYLSGSHHQNNWSIHLSNRKGAHLKLIGVAGLHKVFLDFEKARDMTDQVAKGLGIASAHFI